MTLKEGVMKKKNHRKFNNKKVEAIPILQEKVSKIQHLEIEPQIELVGEDNKNEKSEIDIEPLVPIHVVITKL